MLSLARLKSVLRYEPNTGHFFWLIKNCGGSHPGIGQRAGSLSSSTGYRIICFEKSQYREHRLAWFYMTGKWPKELDHKNGIRSDNRWENLREATRSQNGANSGPRKGLGYKGVHWNKRVQRWQVKISPNGKHIHLGYFDDLAQARAAYDSAAQRHFGSFSRKS